MIQTLKAWWNLPHLLEQQVRATKSLAHSLEILVGTVNKQVEDSSEEPGILVQTDEDFWALQEREREKVKNRGDISPEESLDELDEDNLPGTGSSWVKDGTV